MAESSSDRPEGEDKVREDEASKKDGDAADQPRSGADEAAKADEASDAGARPASEVKPAAAAKGAAPAKAKGAAPAAAPNQGVMTPTNIALLLAAAGLLAFWKGVTIYKSPGRDYYSASAWLFLIAFLATAISAFHFLGGQLAPKPGERVKKLESRLLEALVPAIPFFALYAVVWWVAWDTWKAMYPGNSWLWMFLVGLGVTSWGTWYALKPPSQKDVQADQLPTRRVILLIMLPFFCVFGMIWLAERVAQP